MNIEEVKDNIALLLNNIKKRFEVIDRQSGSKNLLETDLMMEDIRMLYRETDLLRKLSEAEFNSSRSHRERSYTPQDTATSSSSQREPVDEKPLQKTAAAEVHVPEPVPAPVKPAEQPLGESVQPVQQTQAPDTTHSTSEHVVPSTPAQEKPPLQQAPPPMPPAEQQPLQPSFVAEAYQKPAPSAEKVNPPAATPKVRENVPANESSEKRRHLVGEKFSHEKSSVHERLAQIRDDKSIGMRLQFKPVNNIRDAIGLNEKFLFINELFSGDINAYNDAVNNLNAQASVHEAFELLNNLTEDFKWDGHRSADTIEKFANLVQRRYM